MHFLLSASLSFLIYSRLFIVVAVAGERPSSVSPGTIVFSYGPTGWRLPSGVPRIVDTNGNVIYVKPDFTTPAFQNEALKLVIEEANKVAKGLKLADNLPITPSNITESFVGPFGYTLKYAKVGNITTKNYMYGVEQGNKFSDLVVSDYDRTCLGLKEKVTLPISDIDTNQAYMLARSWLGAISMDVDGLNRDCTLHIAVSPIWNGLAKLGSKPRKRFVPIYYVWWTSGAQSAEGSGDVAHVELFAPANRLLQLSVRDPKFILRKPLAFTNLDSLFPGTAPVQTNFPVNTIYLAAPAAN